MKQFLLAHFFCCFWQNH